MTGARSFSCLQFVDIKIQLICAYTALSFMIQHNALRRENCLDPVAFLNEAESSADFLHVCP